jgi:hypothetical protein
MLEYPIKSLLRQGTEIAATMSNSYTAYTQYSLRQINSD